MKTIFYFIFFLIFLAQLFYAKLEEHAQTVISGETVDDVHVFPERLAVLLGDEGGSDLAAARPDAAQILGRQEQMVRSHLTCHRPPLLLRRADHQDLK